MLNKGLILHWTMDNKDTSGGLVYDRSGYDRHGSISGSVDSDQPSIIGESVNLDGSGEYIITSGTHDVPESGYTLAQWINGELSNQPSNNNYTIGWDSKIALSTSNSGNNPRGGILIRNSQDNGYHSVYTGINVLDGTWNHWAATVDIDQLEVTVYINGEEQTSRSIPDHYSGARQYIDGAWGSNSLETNARLSDSRVYNRPLSSREISALYNIRSQPQYQNTLGNGLVSHWTMDTIDTSGNVLYDKSGYSNHGNVGNGTTTSQPGPVNQAYSFDGSGGAVSADNLNSVDLTGDISLTFWLRSDNPTAQRETIIDKAYGGVFTVNVETRPNPTTLRFYHGDAGGNAGSYESNDWNVVNTGSWDHYVFTRDTSSTEEALWKNGSLVSTKPYSISPTQGGNFITVGSGYTNTLEGAMDDVRIYRQKLSELEINRIYNGQ